MTQTSALSISGMVVVDEDADEDRDDLSGDLVPSDACTDGGRKDDCGRDSCLDRFGFE